jgi:hypothetical protein
VHASSRDVMGFKGLRSKVQLYRLEQMQACRLRSHTVDVSPPQAATKIMAGMAEQQTEWWNRMLDGMVE